MNTRSINSEIGRLKPSGISTHTTFHYFLILFIIFSAQLPVFAQDTTEHSPLSLKEALRSNYYPLHLQDNELSGEGADWLKEKAAKATVITLGESHATQEIPAMTTALIQDLQQANEFDYLALEVSSWTAKQMTDNIIAGEAAYNALIEKYPTAIPFYNFENERDLIHQVVQDSDHEQPLWGLDQIFAFATTMAFDRLNELAPSDSARQAIKKLSDAQSSVMAEDPRLQNLPPEIPSPISAFKPEYIDSLHSYFAENEEAIQIINELVKSIQIYRLNDDRNYQSNQLRAEYMRDNLRNYVQKMTEESKEAPKILIKTGARHAYRGMTPNNALDIGNLSVSLARGMGGKAFNVAILCGPGSKGTTFPAQPKSCWPDYLGEEMKLLSRGQAVLIDLTALHPLLHNNDINPDKDLADFLWAFDAVVLIPNAQPAIPITSPVKSNK